MDEPKLRFSPVRANPVQVRPPSAQTDASYIQRPTTTTWHIGCHSTFGYMYCLQISIDLLTFTSVVHSTRSASSTRPSF